jgi:hypothetical protein
MTYLEGEIEKKGNIKIKIKISFKFEIFFDNVILLLFTKIIKRIL